MPSGARRNRTRSDAEHSARSCAALPMWQASPRRTKRWATGRSRRGHQMRVLAGDAQHAAGYRRVLHGRDPPLTDESSGCRELDPAATRGDGRPVRRDGDELPIRWCSGRSPRDGPGGGRRQPRAGTGGPRWTHPLSACRRLDALLADPPLPRAPTARDEGLTASAAGHTAGRARWRRLKQSRPGRSATRPHRPQEAKRLRYAVEARAGGGKRRSAAQAASRCRALSATTRTLWWPSVLRDGLQMQLDGGNGATSACCTGAGRPRSRAAGPAAR